MDPRGRALFAAFYKILRKIESYIYCFFSLKCVSYFNRMKRLGLFEPVCESAMKGRKNMGDKFRRMMQGRYGADQLGQFLSVAALVSVLIGLFTGWSWFSLFGIFLLAWQYFRMFSRNIQKRYNENQGFLLLRRRIVGWFRKERSFADQNKGYRIFKCPSCGQKVRVPKGKGRISIHCPKCGNDFIKRT